MAIEPKEAKLKLIHLVYGLLAAAVVVGLMIGRVMNQQETNTQSIEQKVEKEIFEMHQTQQNVQMGRIDKNYEKIDSKLEVLMNK